MCRQINAVAVLLVACCMPSWTKANDIEIPDSLWCAPQIGAPFSETDSVVITNWESATELRFSDDRTVLDSNGLFSYWDTWNGSPYSNNVLNLYDAMWVPRASLTIYKFNSYTSYLNGAFHCRKEIPKVSERTPLEQQISRPEDIPGCTTAASIQEENAFGWENGQLCTIGDQLACEDHGGFPWGWNSATRTSCRLDEQQCVDSDGDGWGWNGYESCLLSQTTECNYDHSEVNSGWGWNPVTRESCPPKN